MPEILMVRPADLLVDEENPRLSEPNAGQRIAFRALAKDQQRKLLRLAQHIVDHGGLNPSKLPIVTAADGSAGRYLVLEGNRRLSALKALENPDSLVDAVPAGILKEIRKLSAKYREAPIDSVACVVMKDRVEADPWIELEHTGENAGSGVVKWNSIEAGRFRARSGNLEPHLQVVAFLEKRGELRPETRKNMAATSLKRLIETPVVRDRLGIELRNRRLFLLADADKVSKALAYVVEHLPAVGEIYRIGQRIDYANNLPSRVAVKATVEKGQGIALDAAPAGAGGQSASRARPERQRQTLIPNDCVLSISNASRVRHIEGELRKLNVYQLPNAASVLLRVFIELSADCYLERGTLNLPQRPNLGTKLQAIARDLVQRKKLTQQQAKVINKAVSDDSYLVASVELMHQYVHNQYIFPAPGDLIAHWNSIQPFVSAIWSA